MAIDPRPTWDAWGLLLAQAASSRGDCTRRQVGAVVLDQHHRVAGVGYNGAPPGQPGCLTDGACPRGRMSKDQVKPGSSYDTGTGSCIAVHAEQNSLLDCDRDRRRGGTLYVTCEPCDGCWRMIWGAGVARVVWPDAERVAPAPRVSANYGHSWYGVLDSKQARSVHLPAPGQETDPRPRALCGSKRYSLNVAVCYPSHTLGRWGRPKCKRCLALLKTVPIGTKNGPATSNR